MGCWWRICIIALALRIASPAFSQTRALLPSHHLLIPAATTQPTQQPIPDAANQQNALNLIQNIFKSDYVDATPHGRSALAKKLLQQGVQTNDDPPGKFVLLTQCVDASIPAGEPKILTQAIDALAQDFPIDGPAMKTKAYQQICASCWTPIQSEQLADSCINAIQQAIAADEYDNAIQLQSIGQGAANHSQQVDLSRQFQQLHSEVLDIRQQFAQAKLAMARLQKSPDNSHACTQAGSFLCFVKADWNAGLPVLAHGDDPMLASAAKLDLSANQNPQALARAADAWWQISITRPELEREHLQTHAANYYHLAIFNLDGLSKTIAAQHLADFDAGQLRQLHLSPGLSAELFEDKDFSQPNSTRTDSQIDFDWGHQPPTLSMPKVEYSIRWIGKLRTSQPGLYTLTIQANEGAKLILDGKPILESAVGSHRRTAQKVDLQLSAGIHDLRLDYWSGTGLAKCKLSWIPPGSLALVPIPPDAFYHSNDDVNP